MKRQFITTIVGEDSAHLIKRLAEVTRLMGGEWLKSKVMRLDGQFSAMMKVSIDQDKEAALRAKLEKTYPHLQFTYAPAQIMPNEGSRSVSLELDCSDRPGLTHDISKLLSDLNLRTLSMEIHRFPVTPMGTTVYNAKMEIAMPETMSKAQLADNLESLSDCTRVNFE